MLFLLWIDICVRSQKMYCHTHRYLSLMKDISYHLTVYISSLVSKQLTNVEFQQVWKNSMINLYIVHTFMPDAIFQFFFKNMHSDLILHRKL